MTKPVLVADSSPLIALARIRQLDILRQLATRVLVLDPEGNLLGLCRGRAAAP